MMDDNQNDRNPQNNPHNSGKVNPTKEYDEFGNRIVESAPPEPTASEVLEEDLGIVPPISVDGTESEESSVSHQKTTLADGLVSRTDSLNDWTDTLNSNIANKEGDVKTSDVKSSMDLPGVEPGRLGVSVQSSEPARPTLSNSISEKPVAKSSKKLILAAIILFVGVGLILTLYQTRFNNVKIGVVPFLENTSDITKRVGNLVELPVPEEPSDIRNVSDVAKLSGNPFFEKAQNGDVVLLYQKNKTAILYRPKSGKVVAIGFLNLPAPQVAGTSTDASPAASASPSGQKAQNLAE